MARRPGLVEFYSTVVLSDSAQPIFILGTDCFGWIS